jgi:hypothetical protein
MDPIRQDMDTAHSEDETTDVQNTGMVTIRGVLSSPVLARGDLPEITGVVTGPSPQEIALWIFGADVRFFDTIPIQSGDTFRYPVPAFVIELMKGGEYFIILQHPGENGRFDLILMIPKGELVAKNIRNDTHIPVEGFLTRKSEGSVLTEITTALGVDDILFSIPISVQDPYTRINPKSEKMTGQSFSIPGPTDLVRERNYHDHRFDPNGEEKKKSLILISS